MHFPSVLVLGATGRIGTFLLRLAGRGAIGGDILWQSRRPMPGPGWAVFDPLTEPAALAAAARGRQAILCLAGVAPGRGGAMADNARLAAAAVRAGAETGARVLLASSAAVYGTRAGILAETLPPAPVSDYGRAKAGMEARAAELAAGLGVGVTALRIGNVAGADAILGGWRPGFELDRFADGRSPRRSYVGPATLARVLAALAGRDDLPAVLNLAAPGAVEMAALLDAAGLGWRPRPAPDTAIPEVRLDTGALERFVTFGPADGTAAAMVAEWRTLALPDRPQRGRGGR